MDFLTWNSIIHAIPKRWKDIAINEPHLLGKPLYPNAGIGKENKLYNMQDLGKIKIKHLYNILLSNKKVVVPSGQLKFSDYFNINEHDWKKIYSLPRTVARDNKVIDFQF